MKYFEQKHTKFYSFFEVPLLSTFASNTMIQLHLPWYKRSTIFQQRSTTRDSLFSFERMKTCHLYCEINKAENCLSFSATIYQLINDLFMSYFSSIRFIHFVITSIYLGSNSIKGKICTGVDFTNVISVQ